ncbi:hypothetical protein PFAG_02517 [Plasmodium falciparum Santa Lucia]|uniref:Uncharacterized protein n=5 Tax=Plasmodium falciparum TaxID=5833 RepID=A0A024VRE2_PLAFA|nr:hypothetical protein PFFVO_02572 [Plasmodium falciparum Vietnam Oak-Knoll (FVO)]ETW30863.1 hypothetical protein PFFCH_01659 [Plasmodium falciparum FCH/4]ETW61612.1 hypothetical protein PFMC_02530 [Plasmodium falciparum CAMP/Malaysia]EUR72519.1 hypothetical protein PFBG_02610 [Plasmodium falciparum 7G8]EUT86651.1 hypothetical protein PFAG_02517 [Plasmodium falciparum Santa Lucia]
MKFSISYSFLLHLKKYVMIIFFILYGKNLGNSNVLSNDLPLQWCNNSKICNAPFCMMHIKFHYTYVPYMFFI